MSTLLKLADLKAVDKKTTLLHYVVEVVRKNAPNIMRVCELQKVVREATRVSLDELQSKKAETERGLRQVDTEISWHEDQSLREGDAADDDLFPEVFTEFYNWASERKEYFDEALAQASALFREVHFDHLLGLPSPFLSVHGLPWPPTAFHGLPWSSRTSSQLRWPPSPFADAALLGPWQVCALLGEADVKEPEELFDTLDKFVVRVGIASEATQPHALRVPPRADTNRMLVPVYGRCALRRRARRLTRRAGRTRRPRARRP